MTPADDPIYDVWEATGDPTDPAAEDVAALALDRVADPRTDHPYAHLDADLQKIVDRYGERPLRRATYLILVDSYTFRMAAHELGWHPVEGIIVGTAVTQYLRELRRSE